ncbi:MAG: DNA/RNA non-specific endonuclease [Cyanobacteria bacterium P01_F01_bin.86]
MEASRWAVVLGMLGLLGCGLSEGGALSSGAELNALPPCVDDDCNCNDFRDQALAQMVLEAFPEDPFVLDRDGNGLACESLPAVVPGLDTGVLASDSPHLVLGNPSNAATANPNNLLIERSQYALSYNRDRGIANWASWQLNANWLGQTERQDNFRQDGGLPAGFYQVTPNDYRHSGYDRGHIVPSGDRTQSPQDNSATFLMTNILPQVPENNRGAWRELEEYSRDLVYQFGLDLIVIAGGYGEQTQLADGRVTAPSRLWKIIVILEQSEQDLAATGLESPIIAIDMPNQDTVASDWQLYQTTVDRIELATGYDFLSEVPADIQAELEAELATVN